MEDLSDDDEIIDTARAIHARAREVIQLLHTAFPDEVLTAKAMPTVIACMARNMGFSRKNLVRLVEFAYDHFTRDRPAREALD